MPRRNTWNASRFKTANWPAGGSVQGCRATIWCKNVGVQAHHGFEKPCRVVSRKRKGGPHRNGGLNIVRADGESWELWHGDGFSRETAAAVKKTWQEARQPGYDAYRKKLISEDKYRQR